MANGQKKTDPPQEKPKRRRSIQEKRAAQAGPPKPSVLTQAINRAVGLERPTPQTQAATLTGKGSSLRGSIPRTQAQVTPPSTLTQQLPRPIRRGIETAKESPLGRMASTALKLTTEGDPTGGASAFDPIGPGKAIGTLATRPLRRGAEVADPISEILTARNWLGQRVPRFSHTPYEFMAWDPVNPARGLPIIGEYSLEPTLNRNLENLLRAGGQPIPVRAVTPRPLMGGEPVYLRLRNTQPDFSALADDIGRQAIPGADERSIGSLLRHLAHGTPGSDLEMLGAWTGNQWRYRPLEDILNTTPRNFSSTLLSGGLNDEAKRFLLDELMRGTEPGVYEKILSEALTTGLGKDFNIKGVLNEAPVRTGRSIPGMSREPAGDYISKPALNQLRAPAASLEEAAAGRAPKITTQEKALQQLMDKRIEENLVRLFDDPANITPQDWAYVERATVAQVLDDWWKSRGLP